MEIEIEFEKVIPEEEGYYIWRSDAGGFHLVEVKRGQSENVYACGPSGWTWIGKNFGGTWSKKIKMLEGNGYSRDDAGFPQKAGVAQMVEHLPCK